MIKATIGPGGEPTLVASVGGTAVYLDNFAIRSIANGDSSLRQRFVAAIRSGADLVFSIAHAIELLNSDRVKAFLDELGDHWYPIEMVVQKVLKREDRGEPRDKCCFDQDLLKEYFANSTSEHLPGSCKVIDLSEGAFRLGAFVDWSGPREELIALRRKIDEELSDGIRRLRDKAKKDPTWLDRELPAFPFKPSRPVRFAHTNLFRSLIADRGYQMKKGDGIDFGHAVMAAAISSFATLDKQWKQRVEGLPRPNRVPRIYYEPEIPVMVTDIESHIGTNNGGVSHLSPVLA